MEGYHSQKHPSFFLFNSAEIILALHSYKVLQTQWPASTRYLEIFALAQCSPNCEEWLQMEGCSWCPLLKYILDHARSQENSKDLMRIAHLMQSEMMVPGKMTPWKKGARMLVVGTNVLVLVEKGKFLTH